MVEFEFSEKYFSTSSTVSSVTTVYEGPEIYGPEECHSV